MPPARPGPRPRRSLPLSGRAPGASEPAFARRLLLAATLVLAVGPALGCSSEPGPRTSTDIELILVPDVPADTITADTAPAAYDSAPEAADTMPADAAPEAADARPLDVPDAGPLDDVGPVDPATCPVPAMEALYPGPIPPFPYGPWPLAEGCLAAPHDVVIVLGCPSESDGSPSRCQEVRAEMADQLDAAGLAHDFIVTGAAVHNEHVEAHALADLLVARGLPRERIALEPLARHTDENLYYSSLIMRARGWRSALVISDDPGHLMMTGLCDANCCVRLGLMTLLDYEVAPLVLVKAGHYTLFDGPPPDLAVSCEHLAGLAMCMTLPSRLACADDLQVAPP